MKGDTLGLAHRKCNRSKILALGVIEILQSLKGLPKI